VAGNLRLLAERRFGSGNLFGKSMIVIEEISKSIRHHFRVVISYSINVNCFNFNINANRLCVYVLDILFFFRCSRYLHICRTITQAFDREFLQFFTV
jgi:hypothetical protein